VDVNICPKITEMVKDCIVYMMRNNIPISTQTRLTTILWGLLSTFNIAIGFSSKKKNQPNTKEEMHKLCYNFLG